MFVLAVDAGQLESAAKSVFGEGLNFQEYFRKFVHRSVSLPSVIQLRAHERAAFVGSYFLKYLRIPEDSSSAKPLMQVVEDFLSIYEVPIRGFQEVMRIMAHARFRAGVPPESIEYPRDARLFLMSFLRVISRSEYKRLGSSVCCFEKLDEIMLKLSQLKRYPDGQSLARMFSLFAHGFDFSSKEANDALEERLERYFVGSPAEMRSTFDNSGFRGWSKYTEVYQKIESLLAVEG